MLSFKKNPTAAKLFQEKIVPEKLKDKSMCV